MMRIKLADQDLQRLSEMRKLPGSDFAELVNILGLDPNIDFRLADLRHVSFGAADLSDYNLTGANLRGADLSQASYSGAILRGVQSDRETRWNGDPPLITSAALGPPGTLRKVSLLPMIAPIMGGLEEPFRQVLHVLLTYMLPNGLVYLDELIRYAYPGQSSLEAVSSFERFQMQFRELANRASSPLALISSRADAGDGEMHFWFVAESAAQGNFDKAIRGCVFSSDARVLIAAGDDGRIWLWDWTSETGAKSIPAHGSRVWACALSNNGRVLAIALADKKLWLWDPLSWLPLRELRGHQGYVRGCAFSTTGDRLVSTSEDQSVRIWDTATGECQAVLHGHTGRGEGCAFSPAGEKIASAAQDGKVRIWNAFSHELLHSLSPPGAQRWMTSCSFSPDGALVAGTSHNCRTYLWEVETGKLVQVLEGHENWVMACEFAPDGIHIASTSDDATLRIWNVTTGKCEAVMRADQREGLVACSYSRDGRFVGTGASNGRLRVWDVHTSGGVMERSVNSVMLV